MLSEYQDILIRVVVGVASALIAAALLCWIRSREWWPWLKAACGVLVVAICIWVLWIFLRAGPIPVGDPVHLIPETTVTLDAAKREWGCPIDESRGSVTPAGILECSGLRENARYTLCINEYNGQPPAMVLRKIETTDNGEGYWDFLTLQTDGKGRPPGTKLQGTVPEGASGFYYNKPYHVKLFVKDEEQSYCPVLYSDQFVFRFEKINDQ